MCAYCFTSPSRLLFVWFHCCVLLVQLRVISSPCELPNEAWMCRRAASVGVCVCVYSRTEVRVCSHSLVWLRWLNSASGPSCKLVTCQTQSKREKKGTEWTRWKMNCFPMSLLPFVLGAFWTTTRDSYANISIIWIEFKFFIALQKVNFTLRPLALLGHFC